MATKRKGLRESIKPDASAAADAAAAIIGHSPKPGGTIKGAVSGTEAHATQSYHIPVRYIELLARVAMERAMDARHAGRKGEGRISASAILRDILEQHIDELEAELSRRRG